MRLESSPNDLFRFVQLRPPISLISEQLIPLIASTDFFGQLQATTIVSERQSIANNYIDDNSDTGVFIRFLSQLQYGEAIQDFINSTTEFDEPSIDFLITTLLEYLEILNLSELSGRNDFQQDLNRLSDTLLARVYTTYLLPNLDILQNIYRIYYLIFKNASEELIQLGWTRLLRISIVIPEESLSSIISLRRTALSNREATSDLQQEIPVVETLVDRRSQLYRAYKELMRCDQEHNVILPDSELADEAGTNVFALKGEVINGLSDETRQIVEEQRLDLERTPIHSIVMGIYTMLQQEDRHVISALSNRDDLVLGPFDDLPIDITSTRRDIRPSGVGNLLVVKQQVKRYEPSEIAYIENILSGETKTRERRELQQVEETFTSAFESTREEKNELETSQRFELKRETSRTIQQDQNVNFGVKLSGKYGPYVEFSSNFELGTSQSIKETNSNSTNYAQNIVERSLEKVVEQVREERVRRILREVEEKDIHELENSSAEHIRGVYQFVDKVYEAQVFDYGIRMMYDFMIPEPASYLHHLRNQPDSELELPDPPPRFSLSSHDEIDELNYGSLASTYSATEIDPPPDPYVLTSIAINNQGKGEGGVPILAITDKLTIPKGYGPERVEYSAQATTDDDMTLTVLVGSLFSQISRSADRSASFPPFPVSINLNQGNFRYPEGTQLSVGVFGFESRNFIVDLTIFCKRRPETYEQWQIRTFQKIQEAYERRVLEYEEKVASVRAAEAIAQNEADEENNFDSPPSLNRVIERNELKKHTISIVTGSRYEYIDAVMDGDPPYFDFDKAREQGSLIRFFEQVFEWEQMQYVFYPYFWGRTSTWADRFTTENLDPQFREFLKAGAARVVVPVRPGFETSLQHYLDTGKVWDGQGDPPQITSPLYVSIVDEIKERTGATQGEIPVGDSWDVRVPTNLLYVRKNDDLPTWFQNPPGSWQWEPTDLVTTFPLAITDLALVDAEAREDIQPLDNGDVISVASLPPTITIRASANPEYVGSVIFNLNSGQHIQTENNFPYLLYNNNPDEYVGIQPVPGEYTLSVTAYTGPSGLGLASQEKMIQFSLIA